jgi:DNA-binding IclR family transcriptional regulator
MINNRISRVLQVLSLVAFNPEPTRLKEIGDKLGLHPSMVSRIVADLIAGGLLVKSAYRSVIATPALAVLGKSAGKNHPLSRIAREVLQQPVSEMGVSCEFATVAPGGLFHFYQVRRGTPPAEPLWRSDAAAVIFAARGDEWEEVLEELRFAAPGEQESEFPRFKERFLEARESLSLINYHAGRFRQMTLPVKCGIFCCALSVSGFDSADQEKTAFELSRLAARIRSLYNTMLNGDA